MWTPIYMAQSLNIAIRIKQMLEQNDILVYVRPAKTNGECYDLLVPRAELEEAQGLIFANFS
ncbi:MAG: hypothetical protein LBM38_06385 [Clostridiales bacterium]|jgi:hypothetical protein|nr:hypothetical protein [Clostridiales bacterium]